MQHHPEDKPITPTEASQPAASTAASGGSFTTTLIDKLMEYVNQADEVAATKRVQALQGKIPEASTEQVVDELIRRKCMKAGSVGAVTSGAALLPGIGTFASLTFGVAADISMMFKMQAELVLEIAAAHARELSPGEKQRILLLITGVSMGANQALSQAGKKISHKATERLMERSVVKAIPVIGVAASAGTNALSTYVIGRRAHAYFSLGEEHMGDWAESARAITGVDERKIVAWLSVATCQSWHLISPGVKGAASAVHGAGEVTGNFLLDTGRSLFGWGKRAGESAWSAGEKASDYLFWWRRDGQEEPQFLPDSGDMSSVSEVQPGPMPAQVVALIGTAEQSAAEAQARLQEAQSVVESDPETQRSTLSYLNPRRWFRRAEEADVSMGELAAEEEDDDEEGLRIFCPLQWFRRPDPKSSVERPRR